MSDETNSVLYRSELMKRTLIFVTLAITMSSLALGQIRRNKLQEELLRLEKEFAQAIVKNDVEAVGRFLADDWIIIDPDGGIIDKSRFLGVIKSGALTHEMMESDDIRVRIHEDTAVVTGLTTAKGKFSGQAFTTQERTTDVFVKQNGRWQYVLVPLSPEDRDRFAGAWQQEQAGFVDDPRATVANADSLVTEVMKVRGYPMGDFEQRAADISVDHSLVVKNYRIAHDIALRNSGDETSTEELRTALLHYRMLFEDLLTRDAAEPENQKVTAVGALGRQ